MRKLFRRYMPDPATVGRNRVVALLGNTFLQPGLWYLNRRSAARGVAIGMFCGLIPGPFQMLGAALMCLAFRGNLPVALATTLYTNPVTIVPLYLLAFSIGGFIMGSDATFVMPPEKGAQSVLAWCHMLLQWLTGMGQPMAIGLLALATLLAFLGYIVVRLIWRLHLLHALHRRRARRFDNSSA
ncbi:MAG: hypothetical protein JWM03_466, partial [Rhodocyclales bacterium]|nr:hypothetical protein [Rhodocyclales bacterium]